MKRIYFSDDAKADVRAIPQPIALNIPHAVQRLAESGGRDIKTVQLTFVAQAVKPAEPRFISAFLAALDERQVFRVGHETGFHGIILTASPTGATPIGNKKERTTPPRPAPVMTLVL